MTGNNVVIVSKRESNGKNIQRFIRHEKILDKLQEVTQKRDHEKLNTIVDLLLEIDDTQGQKILIGKIISAFKSQKEVLAKIVSLMIQKYFEREDPATFMRENGSFIKNFLKHEAQSWLDNSIARQIKPYLQEFINIINSELKNEDYSQKDFKPSYNIETYKKLLANVLFSIFKAPFDDVVARTSKCIVRFAPSDKADSFISGYIILSVINPAIGDFFGKEENYKDIDQEHVSYVMDQCFCRGGLLFQTTLQSLFGSQQANGMIGQQDALEVAKKNIIGGMQEQAREFIKRLKNSECKIEEIDGIGKDKEKENELFYEVGAIVRRKFDTDIMVRKEAEEKFQKVSENVQSSRMLKILQAKHNIDLNRKLEDVDDARWKRKILEEFISAIKNDDIDERKILKNIKKRLLDKKQLSGFFCAQNDRGREPISVALEYNSDIVNEMLKSCDVHMLISSQSEGENVLCLMIRLGYAQLVKQLIKDYGVPTVANKKDGFTPLMSVIKYKRYELVRTIIKGDDTKYSRLTPRSNLADDEIDGKTVFHKAIEEYADKEMIRKLVKHISGKHLLSLVNKKSLKDLKTPIIAGLIRNRFEEVTYLMGLLIEQDILLIPNDKNAVLYDMKVLLLPSMESVFNGSKSSKCDKTFDKGEIVKRYNNCLKPFLEHVSKIVLNTSKDDSVIIMRSILAFTKEMLSSMKESKYSYCGKNSTNKPNSVQYDAFEERLQIVNKFLSKEIDRVNSKQTRWSCPSVSTLKQNKPLKNDLRSVTSTNLSNTDAWFKKKIFISEHRNTSSVVVRNGCQLLHKPTEKRYKTFHGQTTQKPLPTPPCRSQPITRRPPPIPPRRSQPITRRPPSIPPRRSEIVQGKQTVQEQGATIPKQRAYTEYQSNRVPVRFQPTQPIARVNPPVRSAPGFFQPVHTTRGNQTVVGSIEKGARQIRNLR